MSPTVKNTCAIILCGGRGKRMGGEDKGLLQWQQKPLIEYAIQALKFQLECIYINCNRNREQYASYGLPVLADEIPDYAGPLAGLLTAMQNAAAEYILVVPCDCPTIPQSFFNRLADALSQHPDFDIAIAHDGSRTQPLFGLYRSKLELQLREFLEHNRHKVYDFINHAGYIEVDFSDNPDAFLNFNTPGDMQLPDTSNS